MTTHSKRRQLTDDQWPDLLTNGGREQRLVQWLFRHLPSSPRCKQCFTPFSGFGGKIMSVAGFRPSRKNPGLCARCLEELPLGGAEVDIAVMFADVRSSTEQADRLGPTEFAGLMNRFYRTATDVLVARGAIIDKMIGDEVMALFIPGYTGSSYYAQAVAAAVELVRAVGFGEKSDSWLSIGVGVHGGPAFVGTVGSGEVTDFTALGDTVNTAARLQGEAAPGEIVVSEAVYYDVAHTYPGLEQRVLNVRGREQPLAVRVLLRLKRNNPA